MWNRTRITSNGKITVKIQFAQIGYSVNVNGKNRGNYTRRHMAETAAIALLNA